MRGWTNIVDGVFGGIDELLGTVDKTKRMGYENLNRTPGATICRGLAQMLWIPVILRATYKMGCFVYYSIMGPSVGFTLYKHVESTNAHYLAGKKHLENNDYRQAIEHFTKGIEEGDVDSVYERMSIYLNSYEPKDTITSFRPKEKQLINILKKTSERCIRAEYLYYVCSVSGYHEKRNAFEAS